MADQSKIKDALNHTTTFKYFKHGGVKSVQPPSGGAYTYQYDNRPRLIYKKIPGAPAQILRYSNQNNLLHYTIDGKGQRIDHYYDEYLRERRTTLATVTNWDPESSSVSHGAPGSDILITRYGEEFPDLPQIYKGRVRQTEAKLYGSGPVAASGFTQATFSYDNFGRAINRAETLPVLPLSGTVPGTDTWELLFDHADRLKFEGRSHAGAASVSTTHSHEYDNFGRELYYSFGAGQPSGAAVAMSWNDRDQMTSKKLGYAGTRSLDLINYRYNERGWLTDINDVIRERWETPYAICQGEAGEEETSQQHPDHILDLAKLSGGGSVTSLVHAKESCAGAKTFSLDEKPSWSIGGLKIEPRSTWGHSKGGMSYVVTGLAKPVVVVGDALFASSMGGGMVSFAEALATTRKELFTLPDETVVCPGHGPLTTVCEEKAYNPFYPEHK